MASETFFAQESANRRNSFLLVLVVCALFGALGFAIGYAIVGERQRGAHRDGHRVLGRHPHLPEQLLRRRSTGPRRVRREAGHRGPDAATLQCHPRADDRREHPHAGGLSHRRQRPQRVRHGRDPKHSSIAITTGLLQKLDREELQGVIGHELSHVRNFDIRFTLLVGVLVGSIALLADFFLRFTFWGGGRRPTTGIRGGGGLQAVMFVVAILFAILAPIAARLVQLAVSRQREYLADASSVELTRNPAGLERALAKIASDKDVLEVANRATQHLYFTNPIKKFEARSGSMFDTHPPIVDRINRLRQLSGERPMDSAEFNALRGLD